MNKTSLIKFYIQHRFIIFPAVVMFLSLLLIVFAIYPQTVKLIENQKVISDLSGKTKLLQNKVSALESYDAQDLSRKVGFVLSSLPAEKDFLNAFGLLQRLAAQSGFNISSISLGNVAGKQGSANSFGLHMEMQGSKTSLQTLLDNFESSPRIIRVGNIDASSAQNSGAVKLSLDVEVLYSPVPADFGKIDSSLPELSQKDQDLIANLAKSIPALNPQQPSPASASARGKVNPFE